jgi:WD40 repeat protein
MAAEAFEMSLIANQHTAKPPPAILRQTTARSGGSKEASAVQSSSSELTWHRQSSTCGTKFDVLEAAFSSDGRWLVTASEDGTAVIAALADDTGEFVSVAKLEHPQRPNRESKGLDAPVAVPCAAFAPQTTETEEMFRKNHAEHHGVDNVWASMTTPRLVTCSEDGHVRIYDLSLICDPEKSIEARPSALPRPIVLKHKGTSTPETPRNVAWKESVRSVAWSADGLHIVAGTFSSTAILWSWAPPPEWKLDVDSTAQQQEKLRRASTAGVQADFSKAPMKITEFIGHTGFVWRAVFSHHTSKVGLRIVTASNDHTAKVWQCVEPVVVRKQS